MGTKIDNISEGRVFSFKNTLNFKGNLIHIHTPIVMGILNVTPDSFYDGGRYVNSELTLLQQTEKMLAEGATIIDIGGYSSRPGADHISEEEEKRRAVSCVKLVAGHFPKAYISIDTFRATVARDAVDAGASMVNDISGGGLDNAMFDTVAALKVPYVMMHMRGTPQTMKTLTDYDDLCDEIIDYFQQRVALLRDKGVADIVIDPGFGFAKNIDQNYELLGKLHTLKMLELPILVGLSRKSMIYKRLKISVDDALNGTTALNAMALVQGASILRVHDVKEAVQTIKLFKYTYS